MYVCIYIYIYMYVCKINIHDMVLLPYNRGVPKRLPYQFLDEGGNAAATWLSARRFTQRFIEGSLETKVPTIWTDEKQHSQEEAEPGRNSDV